LNEDLAEAIALAHDLGHTPFGHAGERALDRLLRGDGGFDHNRQTLRVVDLLEERYPGFRGLNLSYETREGILKHGAHWDHPVPLPDRSGQTPLEAQVADRSDEIAYTNHDLDDGLRSGLITLEQLDEVPLWKRVHAETRDRMPGAAGAVLRAQTIVALINHLVMDLAEATANRLDEARPADVGAVRAASARWVEYTPALAKELRALKEFLYRGLYYHPHVVGMTEKAERVLEELWTVYRSDPNAVPEQVRDHFAADGEARAIADYVAGMTDRFALAEHRRLTHGAGLD
jgi:dGTPase